MARSSSREVKQKKSKKDKHSKKDKEERSRRGKSSDSDRSASRHRKSKERRERRDKQKEKEKDKERDVQKEKVKQKEKEKQKDKQKEKEREREKEREKEKQRKQTDSNKNRRQRERSRSRSIQIRQGRKHSRQRSRSRDKRPEMAREDEAQLKKKRLAMARLLFINEAALLNNNTPNKKEEDAAKSEESKLEGKQPKKKSRWEKSANTPDVPEQAVPTREVPKSETTKPLAMKPEEENNDLKNLSLDVPCRSDERDLYKISGSVDMEESEPLDKNTGTFEDDTLEAYFKEIQGEAVPQMSLPKAGRQTFVTYEDIVTVNTFQPRALLEEKEEEGDKFKQQFLAAFQKINPQETKMEEEKAEKEQDQVQILDGNDSEEDQDKLDEEEDDNFLDKQKRLAQRKEFQQIDHAKMKYEEVKFNLYRQSEEIKGLTKTQVDKYRKEAGDIKIRGKDIPNPVFNWYQCGLSDKVLEIIEERHYKKPFPIQAQSFPLMMSGRDVIGIAETGSGKTLAYLIPVIKHIENQRKVEEGEGPIALIMTPTRELTRQVHDEFKKFCKPMGIRCLSVYGGLGMQTQLSDLKRGAEIIICTPGRMIDVLTLNNGKITNLRRVTMVVMDQADRMFDLGFEPQITKVLNNIRPLRQTVMFSATFPKNVELLAKRILRKPAEIIVGSRGQACSNIDQIVEVREETTKFWRLLELLGHWHSKGSILIFVDKKSEVDLLFKELVSYGYYSLPLHSGMDSTDREFTIYDFKKGVRSIMIATSICSRGLDIKNIVLVINYKCPNHLEDYIHRIGRTGRAGNKGTAITFITVEEEQYSIDMLKALEMADIAPTQELKTLAENYLARVKKGEAKKIRNRNLMGAGFKFNEDEEDKDQEFKDIVKKQLKAEGLGAFEDSDDEDIEKQKKREEDKRGRTDKERAVEAIRDPELKQKLLIETAKALNDAMRDGIPMTTEKILKLAVEKMKQEVTKHVVIKTAEQGQQRVLQIIDEFEKTNPNPTFSYDFEVNDYPLNARSRVTSHQFLSQIKQLTSCTVSVRGQYFEAGKKIPVGSRKLYLHIQGQNKVYVSTAYKDIKRMLQEESMQNYQGQLAIKYGM